MFIQKAELESVVREFPGLRLIFPLTAFALDTLASLYPIYKEAKPEETARLFSPIAGSETAPTFLVTTNDGRIPFFWVANDGEVNRMILVGGPSEGYEAYSEDEVRNTIRNILMANEVNDFLGLKEEDLEYCYQSAPLTSLEKVVRNDVSNEGSISPRLRRKRFNYNELPYPLSDEEKRSIDILNAYPINDHMLYVNTFFDAVLNIHRIDDSLPDLDEIMERVIECSGKCNQAEAKQLISRLFSCHGLFMVTFFTCGRDFYNAFALQCLDNVKRYGTDVICMDAMRFLAGRINPQGGTESDKAEQLYFLFFNNTFMSSVSLHESIVDMNTMAERASFLPPIDVMKKHSEVTFSMAEIYIYNSQIDENEFRMLRFNSDFLFRNATFLFDLHAMNEGLFSKLLEGMSTTEKAKTIQRLALSSSLFFSQSNSITPEWKALFWDVQCWDGQGDILDIVTHHIDKWECGSSMPATFTQHVCSRQQKLTKVAKLRPITFTSH